MPLKFPKVSCNIGSYDWAHPSEKQLQYYWVLPEGAPFDRFSYTVPCDEYDETDDPYEAIDNSLEYATRCLYCGRLEKLKLLKKYLEDNFAKHRYYYLKDKEARLEKELAETSLEVIDAHEAFIEASGSPWLEST
jgi:hypothetical protein